jgi:co-chaperonin GroES (HSP10)
LTKENPLKCTKDFVLLKPRATPEKIGLIYLPQDAKSLTVGVATVVAVGEGEWLTEAARHEPPPVAVGDTVWYNDLAGTFLDEQKSLVRVRSCDIYAILEGAGTLTESTKVDVRRRDIL